MSAQPHKRRANAGVQKGLLAGLLLCIMGLVLMVLGSAWVGEQHLEPGSESRQLVRLEEAGQGTLQATATVAKPALPVDNTPERARLLLADMAPLLWPTHGPASDSVKATLLCFCLREGPETVRELRHLAAKKFIY